eukprot:TRINITY_DN962_c0_g2_i1.p1 TRINITY_DN962_c0_g2~~TRINITY_DN962_c0_g2_i1.p1  ORF type:complete len:1233 (+),score=291.91 TRINITY_DN962_c0_g2_i1:19-3717(+)
MSRKDSEKHNLSFRSSNSDEPRFDDEENTENSSSSSTLVERVHGEFVYTRATILEQFKPYPLPKEFIQLPHITSKECLLPVALSPIQESIEENGQSKFFPTPGRGRGLSRGRGRGRGRGGKGDVLRSSWSPGLKEGNSRFPSHSKNDSLDELFDNYDDGDEPGNLSSSLDNLEIDDEYQKGSNQREQEEEVEWVYKDPQGDLQGPFINAQMKEWFAAGYFPASLLLRTVHEKTFVPLYQRTRDHENPFAPPPRPPSSTRSSARRTLHSSIDEQEPYLPSSNSSSAPAPAPVSGLPPSSHIRKEPLPQAPAQSVLDSSDEEDLPHNEKEPRENLGFSGEERDSGWPKKRNEELKSSQDGRLSLKSSYDSRDESEVAQSTHSASQQSHSSSTPSQGQGHGQGHGIQVAVPDYGAGVAPSQQQQQQPLKRKEGVWSLDELEQTMSLPSSTDLPHSHHQPLSQLQLQSQPQSPFDKLANAWRTSGPTPATVAAGAGSSSSSWRATSLGAPTRSPDENYHTGTHTQQFRSGFPASWATGGRHLDETEGFRDVQQQEQEPKGGWGSGPGKDGGFWGGFENQSSLSSSDDQVEEVHDDELRKLHMLYQQQILQDDPLDNSRWGSSTSSVVQNPHPYSHGLGLADRDTSSLHKKFHDPAVVPLSEEQLLQLQKQQQQSYYHQLMLQQQQQQYNSRWINRFDGQDLYNKPVSPSVNTPLQQQQQPGKKERNASQNQSVYFSEESMSRFLSGQGGLGLFSQESPAYHPDRLDVDKISQHSAWGPLPVNRPSSFQTLGHPHQLQQLYDTDGIAAVPTVFWESTGEELRTPLIHNGLPISLAHHTPESIGGHGPVHSASAPILGQPGHGAYTQLSTQTSQRPIQQLKQIGTLSQDQHQPLLFDQQSQNLHAQFSKPSSKQQPTSKQTPQTTTLGLGTSSSVGTIPQPSGSTVPTGVSSKQAKQSKQSPKTSQPQLLSQVQGQGSIPKQPTTSVADSTSVGSQPSAPVAKSQVPKQHPSKQQTFQNSQMPQASAKSSARPPPVLGSDFPSLPTSGGLDDSRGKKKTEGSSISQTTKNDGQPPFQGSVNFNQWCNKALKELGASGDHYSTLANLKTAAEVREYIRSRFGNSKQASTFANEFVQKRFSDPSWAINVTPSGFGSGPNPTSLNVSPGITAAKGKINELPTPKEAQEKDARERKEGAVPSGAGRVAPASEKKSKKRVQKVDPSLIFSFSGYGRGDAEVEK